MSYSRPHRALGVDIVEQGSSADTQSIARGSTGQNLAPLTQDNTTSDWITGITQVVKGGFDVAGAAIRGGQNQSSSPSAPGEPSSSWYQLPSFAPTSPGAAPAAGMPGWVLPVAVVGGVGALGLIWLAVKR